MVGSGYKKLMWGILISALHINIGTAIGVIQILPSTVGFYIMYLGAKELYEGAELDYMQKVKKDAMTMVMISAAYWAYGFLFDYTGVVGKGLGICTYIMELLLYGDMLNMTVKYYKENGRTREADLMRKKRMTFIKCFMALLVVHLINMIPFSAINENLFLITTFLGYTCDTLMAMMKIWLSLIIQKLGNE